MKKYYWIGSSVTFIVIFNLGYIFHDLMLGDWLHEKEAAISREDYVIPVIAIAFLLYTFILTFLLPVFYFYAQVKYGWSLAKTSILFGCLMGFLWDGLQGGLIEYATFNVPIEVFFVDSTYHTVEGGLAMFLLSLFYKRFALS